MAAPKRKAGRPERKRVLSDVQIETIARMRLERFTQQEIADQLGVHHSTVQAHLKSHVLPAWKERMGATIEEDCARVELLERMAWQQVRAALEGQTLTESERVKLEANLEEIQKTAKGKRKTTNGRAGETKPLQEIEKIITRKAPSLTLWVEVIRWAVEFRCKIRGDFQPDRLDGSSGPVTPTVEIVITDRRELEQPITPETLRGMLATKSN